MPKYIATVRIKADDKCYMPGDELPAAVAKEAVKANACKSVAVDAAADEPKIPDVELGGLYLLPDGSQVKVIKASKTKVTCEDGDGKKVEIPAADWKGEPVKGGE